MIIHTRRFEIVLPGIEKPRCFGVVRTSLRRVIFLLSSRLYGRHLNLTGSTSLLRRSRALLTADRGISPRPEVNVNITNSLRAVNKKRTAQPFLNGAPYIVCRGRILQFEDHNVRALNFTFSCRRSLREALNQFFREYLINLKLLIQIKYLYLHYIVYEIVMYPVYSNPNPI